MTVLERTANEERMTELEQEVTERTENASKAVPSDSIPTRRVSKYHPSVWK